MPAIHFRPRHARALIRRVALCALFALQGSLALSPLLEPRDTRAPAAHMERTGERHLNVHNESTCMLCAARALHAAPSLPAAPAMLGARLSLYPSQSTGAVPALDDFGSHPSRAPPRLS